MQKEMKEKVEMLSVIHDMIREWKKGMAPYQQLMFDRFWIMNGMNPLLLLKTNPWEVPTVDIDSVIHWNQCILSESLSDWLFENRPYMDSFLHYAEYLFIYPAIDMNYRYLKGIKIDDIYVADVKDLLSWDVDHTVQMLLFVRSVDVYKDKHNVLSRSNDNDINTDWLKRKTK